MECLANQIAPAVANAEQFELTNQERQRAATTSAQLSAVLEGVDAGLLLVGEDRQVLWLNQRYAKFFGVETDPENSAETGSFNLERLRQDTRRCFAQPEEYYANLDQILLSSPALR